MRAKAMTLTFVERTKKHFLFLIEEYGFTLSHEKVADRDPEMEGIVKYDSQTTFVVIHGGMGGVGVGFGRIKDSKGEKNFLAPSLTAGIVYEYKAFSAKERAIVLSFDPKDDAKASKLIDLKRLSWRGRLDDVMGELERQLAEEARWLRKYANPFLRGDFSQWLEIYQYMVARQRAEYARRHGGKENVGLIMKRGEDGAMRKLGEKTLWQDYLEELRKEYAKDGASGNSKLAIKRWLEKTLPKK
jgi:hypothetical protein